VTSSATAITANEMFTCALVDGGAYCWGYNEYGRLGNGNTLNQNTPVPVPGFNRGVTAISAGLSHACAIRDGSVYCWGSDAQGQLGNAAVGDQWLPVDVSL